MGGGRLQDSTGIGLATGFASVLHGFGFLMANPRTWPFAVVPVIVLVVTAVGASWLAMVFVIPEAVARLPEATSTPGRWSLQAAEWAARALVIVASATVALVLTPMLSSPALERIVDQQEEALGAPRRAPQSFFAEMWCGLRAQIGGWAVGLPALWTLGIVGLLVPPLSIPAAALQYLVLALLLAWNLLDYPLTLRGMKLRERFEKLRTHWRATLGFGLGFAAVFAVPCGAIVLLPAGVAGATRLSILIDRDAELST